MAAKQGGLRLNAHSALSAGGSAQPINQSMARNGRGVAVLRFERITTPSQHPAVNQQERIIECREVVQGPFGQENNMPIKQLRCLRH
jgi:hypothetical protein